MILLKYTSAEKLFVYIVGTLRNLLATEPFRTPVMYGATVLLYGKCTRSVNSLMTTCRDKKRRISCGPTVSLSARNLSAHVEMLVGGTCRQADLRAVGQSFYNERPVRQCSRFVDAQ